jgi:hypothetical protein
MMSNLGDWIALLFIVGIVYLIVRPKSKAVEAVDAFGRMMVEMVRRAVDLAET